jgi:hypothetical protein
MFKKCYRTCPRPDGAVRRAPRRTKPSLERLDVRIAPSGLQPGLPAAYHMPGGQPVVVIGLTAETSVAHPQ